jgi:NIMA (never in mitosis gene a)-related kinase
MEYADNGDLFQKISENQKNKTTFAEQDIWRIFIQVVRGLKAMHDLNIMHRDLKSANVFLYKDFTAKLGDMNVSKVANKRGLNYTQTGTQYYASPEVWRDEPYDVKSDIWSLGCVLYEMIALKPPFTADDMQGLYKKVLKGHFPRIPKSYSHDLWTMCKTLIQVTPSSRPNCE